MSTTFEAQTAVGSAGVFRVRFGCADAVHEARLLTFLRQNGHFAYAAASGMETVCVGTTPGALYELLEDVLHWWEAEPEAALSVELVATATA